MTHGIEAGSAVAHGAGLGVELGDPEHPLDASRLAGIARLEPRPGTPPAVSLHPVAAARVDEAAAIVAQIVARRQVVYGITTGFGAFQDRFIPLPDITQL